MYKNKINKFLNTIERIPVSISEVTVKTFDTCIRTVLWTPVAIKESFNDSYYSEKNRKSISTQVVENMLWLIKYHRANKFYHLYGLDVLGNNAKKYIDEISFWNGLNALNYRKGIDSQICLLRDKFLFYKYMRSNNLPVPNVFAIIRGEDV